MRSLSRMPFFTSHLTCVIWQCPCPFHSSLPVIDETHRSTSLTRWRIGSWWYAIGSFLLFRSRVALLTLLTGKFDNHLTSLICMYLFTKIAHSGLFPLPGHYLVVPVAAVEWYCDTVQRCLVFSMCLSMPHDTEPSFRDNYFHTWSMPNDGLWYVRHSLIRPHVPRCKKVELRSAVWNVCVALRKICVSSDVTSM